MVVVVQKYGGTSLCTPERIKAVARRIAVERRVGHGVAVVVSARGDTTDELLALAAELSPRPDRRELDQLLATGEAQSMALLAIALGELGLPACSLSGAQAGIHTVGHHGKARIGRVTPRRVEAALAGGGVAIVAGFQGVNGRRDVQTLGRGGSDTTAVALAAALGAARCDIFTDVEGIYTADPRIVPDVVRLPWVSYAEGAEMAWRGARVMHPRAIELAALYGVEVLVRSSLNDRPGTIIGAGGAMERAGTLSGVVHDLDVARVTVAGLPPGPATLAQIFTPLAAAEISVDVIAESTGPGGEIELGFTIGEGELATALPLIERAARGWGARRAAPAPGTAEAGVRVVAQSGLAKVSLVGTGMLNRPGYVARLFATLAAAGVDCLMVSTSEISVTCVVRREAAEEAVRRIHDQFRADFVAVGEHATSPMRNAGDPLAGVGVGKGGGAAVNGST